MSRAAERTGSSDGADGRPAALHSALLISIGVPHGFSTRHGGRSVGMFATLNFGNPGDLAAERRDPAGNINENWGRLCQAIGRAVPAAAPGLERREIVEVHQVHGAGVCVVRRGEPSARAATGHDVRADAIVTDDPGRLAAVRVADCTPVLVSSGDGRIVAAVHAGWRGVVGGVVGTAIDAMRAMGAEPGKMAAAVGPCIGAGAFEVGPEVADEFRRVFGATTVHVRPRGDGKAMVDLKGAIREQLLRAGVSAGRIDVLPHCTVRDAADFFSHRRERGMTGRMVGIIGAR
jgi:hypothetical protein